MKKIFLLILFLIVSVALFAQRKDAVLGLPNGTTQFGTIMPANSLLLNWSTNEMWKTTAVSTATSTINTISKVAIPSSVPSADNSDSLGHKPPSYYRDTLIVKYCNGCLGHSGWIRSGDTIKIDTSYFGLIRAVNDSITNQRTDIDALYDTASAHRIILNAHSDSIINLRTETDRLNDSITEHRIVINSVFDSLSTHRTDINNLNDSLALTQKIRDTLTWDATQYDLAKMVTDTSYFNGNRTILQSGWTGVTGTNKGTGTVKDFLEAVFFPFVPATISINNTSVLNEVGSVATVYTISGATTVNSETIFSNGGVYKTYPLVDAGLYYNFGAATNYSTTFTFEPMQDSVSGANAQDVRFRSQQLVGNNGSPTTIYSSIKYLLSTYPYIYGTDSTAALIGGGSAFYGVMSKLVETVGNKTVGFNTADLKYFWFAYPATYADLTSILDQNGFEQITNFTKYTVNVSSTGLSNDWSNVSYKIYRSNAKAFTVGTWNYQFIY